MKNKVLVLSAVLSLASVGLAGGPTLEELGVADVNAEVVLGQWHGGYDRCRNLADSQGLPMIVYYGKKGCSRCDKLSSTLASDTFVNWRQGKNLILLYMKEGTGGNGYGKGTSGYRFASSEIKTESESGFPYFGYYLCRPDGTIVKLGFGKSAKGFSAATIIKYAEQTFGDALTGGSVKPIEVITDPFAGNKTYLAAYYVGDSLFGILTVKAGRANKSRESKLSGYIMAVDGKKYSFTATKASVSGRYVQPQLVFKKLGLTIVPTLKQDVIEGADLEQVIVGGNLTSGNPSFTMNEPAIATMPAGYSLLPLLPNDYPFTVSGKKWNFGNAPVVSYVKSGDTYVLSGIGDPQKPNYENVKLSYNSSTGVFKGTCKILVSNEGNTSTKPVVKKISAKIYGFIVNGVGIGRVTVGGSYAPVWIK